jgi:hypothetical protein
MIATPVGVLAINHTGLIWMQLQSDFRQPRSQGIPYHDGLLLAAAVNHCIVAITFERHGRVFPGQPHIERIVQIQVSQDRGYR